MPGINAVKCPHCLESVHESWEHAGALGGGDRDYMGWSVEYMRCPACNRIVIRTVAYRLAPVPGNEIATVPEYRVVYPAGVARSPLPDTVPADVAEDYREASIVLPFSAKASAALSRRSLQHLLREYGQVKPSTLSDEIEEAMGKLPSHLADAIDAVRVIGNFAAHPIKSTSTGQVVDVEPGEAEWTLETVEALIDHYIVAPARLAEKRAAFNAKLGDVGKPELKSQDTT